MLRNFNPSQAAGVAVTVTVTGGGHDVSEAVGVGVAVLDVGCGASHVPYSGEQDSAAQNSSDEPLVESVKREMSK